ncbi:MAG: serine/threonine protein kinase [Gemmatimonadetes bacterium]|nr:serine/threonine protein kinase [Gemmatimonadota bacterium]
MKVCSTCGKQWPDEQKFCPNDGSALRSAGGSADLVGSVIAGNYHIQKKLGEGGMGAVYLGEHVKMGRKSAIKVMTQSMAHDPDAIARFNREATNASRINHPNVCAIYDFGETPDGLIYLAMEFIEGGSLSSVIEEGAMAPARAARILEQAGDALSAAHDLGIVHRDLKPDNIMITKGKDGDVVKVVDFGIAKAMGGEEGQKVTKTGLVVGTPEYMSPEQLSGDTLDGRSDIYSLALVFYRMLTGTLPFLADSAQETMIKRLTDDPLPLNEAMPGANFPARLQAVMDRALTRMPADRYTSAAEFAHDAAAALEGVERPSAVPITEGATQMIDAAKTAQIAQTRVGGGKGKTAIKTPETPMPQPVVAAPKKKSSMAMIAAIVGVVVGGGGAAAVMLRPTPGANGDQKQVTSPVTDDTANKGTVSDPVVGTPNPGTQRPVTRPDPVRPTGQPGNTQTTTSAAVVSRPDSGAIDRELTDLLDQVIDETTRLKARNRAEKIYDMVGVPPVLRADAASLVAQAFQEDGQKDAACRWIGVAKNLWASKPLYSNLQQRFGCP